MDSLFLFYKSLLLSISRYIEKIADINGVALIYLGNRRYKWSCADIISFTKTFHIIKRFFHIMKCTCD
ncbi:hypothetical protein BTO25_08755 [Bacillus sp. MB366]|nr:hypothetical protein CPZ31_24005 [Bacillus cereus]KAA0757530.1 hypothetical protein DN401_07285 [Bacillus sp. BF2-3]OLR82521.1 hypothetical protein BTO25_08755 [Bacillus sp. MB366]QCC42902.1 hypothetical protein C3Y97_24765 [Bacillus sp. DU-106]QFR26922.1 hypothetical protein FQZ25_02760 [Bacillus thuringiensis]RKN56862.1 hypothetical protein D7H67_20285 [Bacillus sp. S66]